MLFMPDGGCVVGAMKNQPHEEPNGAAQPGADGRLVGLGVLGGMS